MYHIVPEIGFSNYIVVHWDCHGAVRSVYPTVYEFPRCREVGFIQRLYIYYFHGREVGFTRRFRMGTWDGTLLVYV